MTNFMVPTDSKFVDAIAKAIARDRIMKGAAETIGSPEVFENVEELFDRMFESLWNGDTEIDNQQRISYRNDALAAINAINLRMITLTD
jgi:hypothetical protein